MTNITGHIKYIVLYLVIAVFFACQSPGKNSTGSEYMPEMGHSIAYEANYYNYYYNNTWGTEDEYYKLAKPREPVAGTIARGYAGSTDLGKAADAVPAPNGSVPYYYGSTEEERTRAMNDIIDNPYPITDAGLAKGKELYDIFCGICHGDNGDGNGYLVREDGGVYPVQPANMLLPEFVSATNGRYYHAIMQGKNKMGAYADKLNYEERWQVIHYIRGLQAKELKLEYNQLVNTLNDIERPAGPEVEVAMDMSHGDGAGHDSDEEAHTNEADH